MAEETTELITRILQALLQDILIEDLVDGENIKSKRGRKRYRASIKSDLDKIKQNDPDGLFELYGLFFWAQILMPKYSEPVYEETVALFKRLKTAVDTPQKKRKRGGTEMETCTDNGFFLCSTLYYLADKVFPEFRKQMHREAEALFRKQIEDLNDQQDKPKKKRRRCKKRKQKQDIPTVNDEISSFGKSGVKPRGKIPSEHAEILRKHYPEIMKNIRVKDIIDQMFRENLIDSDEMDEIETKLKSEGNRESMRHLMKILFNSGHAALPTFISCLDERGYFEIAKLLGGQH